MAGVAIAGGAAVVCPVLVVVAAALDDLAHEAVQGV